MAETKTFQEPIALVRQAVNLLVADLQAAIAARGSAVWVMAGGTLPAVAYKELASKHIKSLDWSKVILVMGDERCVPLGDQDSNWGQAERLFLHAVTVSELSVRPQPELGLAAMAQAYDKALQQLPEFDVVWLGVGEDGHTLSLFPGRAEAASEQLVVAVHDVPKPPADRITLTLAALKNTRRAYVLAAGAEKREVIERARHGDLALPITQAVQVVTAIGGSVTWLLDEAAAGLN